MPDDVGMGRRAGTSADRIVFLGHSSVLIELDGVRLLTDPLLRWRVAHLRRQPPPLDRSLTSDIDAVLISHLHHDHLDLASLRLLGRDVPLLVPAGSAAWLHRRRFTAVKELRAGQRATVAEIAVDAVEARHDGRRVGGPRAEALGYIVRNRRAIYFAGDTELFDEMSRLRGQLDVALLPVAGWGRTLGPGHMDPLQAARAAALLGPRLAIPIHWGTLRPISLIARRDPRLHDPARRFAEHVCQIAAGVEVRILMPGEGAAL
jgi:L-ascorbate metabolism protein UlaG (beta-lactamase superfamily)